MRGLSTPGVKNPQRKDGDRDGAESLLDEVEAHSFRSTAARASYFALDRPDQAFETTEFCRRMSSPTKADVSALRWASQYLLSARRLVYEFPWPPEANLDVFVDTDFAGCLASRRSTSRGAAMRGSHLIKHWSSTHKAVTLSSAEDELCGIVKGTTEALGIQSVARDLGLSTTLSIHANSAAAVGICKGAGIGRVEHLAVEQLWVQEGLRRADFRLFKVQSYGPRQPSDKARSLLCMTALLYTWILFLREVQTRSSQVQSSSKRLHPCIGLDFFSLL